MSDSQLISMLLTSGQNIDSLWNFYVTVHLGIAGAIIYSKRIDRSYVLVFAIGYSVFSLINFRAKDNEYKLYTSIVSAIKESSSFDELPATIKLFFNAYDVDDRLMINIGVHMLTAISVLLLLLIRIRNEQALKVKRNTSKP